MKGKAKFLPFELSCCAGLVLARVVTSTGLEERLPIEDLRVPLEYDSEGLVRTEFLADSAVIVAGEDLVASNATVKFYGADGLLEMSVEAEECDCSKDSQRVSSQSRVRIVKGDVVIGSSWLVLLSTKQKGRSRLRPLPFRRPGKWNNLLTATYRPDVEIIVFTT